MNIRLKFRQWKRGYKRWKARLKFRRNQQKHARITSKKKNVEKWSENDCFMKADYLDYKWQKNNPYYERQVYKYDCKCHGTNIKKCKSTVKQLQNLQVSKKQHNLQISKEQQNLQIFKEQQNLQISKEQQNLQISKGLQKKQNNQSSSEKSKIRDCIEPVYQPTKMEAGILRPKAFSSKHSKHTRQSWDYADLKPDEQHETCACQTTQRYSFRKEKEESARKQRQWEKKKHQWEVQESYGRPDYQLLNLQERIHANGCEVVDKDNLETEWKMFAKERFLTRSLSHGNDDYELDIKTKTRHSYHGNENVDERFKRGCKGRCSCDIARQYSKKMSEKYGENLDEIAEIKDKKSVKYPTHHANQTNTLINKFNRVQIKEEKAKAKAKEKELNDRRKKSDNDKKLKKLHDHNNCSCKLAKEYSEKKEKEYEERRAKLNQRNIADNLFNARIEKKTSRTKDSKQKTKSAGPIRHVNTENSKESIDDDYDCGHGACSCKIARAFTIQKEREYQEKRKRELLRTKSESEASRRNEGKGRIEHKRRSTGGITEKSLKKMPNDPDLKVTLYKGFKDSNNGAKMNISCNNECDSKSDESQTYSNHVKRFQWETFDDPFAPVDSVPMTIKSQSVQPNLYVTDEPIILSPDDWTPVKEVYSSNTKQSIQSSGNEINAKEAIELNEPTEEFDQSFDFNGQLPKLDVKDWTPEKETYNSNQKIKHQSKLEPKNWIPVKDQFCRTETMPDSSNNQNNIHPRNCSYKQESADCLIDFASESSKHSSCHATPNSVSRNSSSFESNNFANRLVVDMPVPHTAAELYNQYAAQFSQSHEYPYIPVEEWTPNKHQNHENIEMNDESIMNDDDKAYSLFPADPFDPFMSKGRESRKETNLEDEKSFTPYLSKPTKSGCTSSSTESSKMPNSPNRDSCFAYNENAINELVNVRKMRKKTKDKKGTWSKLNAVLAKKEYDNLTEVPDDLEDLYEEWEDDEYVVIEKDS